MSLKQIKCRVHPHHSGPKNTRGPHDVKIGVSRLPEMLHDWDGKKYPPRFHIEQPDSDTNLTLLTIVFAKPSAELPGSCRGLKLHNGSLWRIGKLACPASRRNPEQRETVEVWDRMKPSHITVNVKGRYIRNLEHPMPVGGWEGTVEDGPGWVIFRLQACTHKVTGIEKTKTILQPGDPDFEQTIRDQG